MASALGEDSCVRLALLYDSVAQLVEHLTFNQRVARSNRVGVTSVQIFSHGFLHFPCFSFYLHEELASGHTADRGLVSKFG